MDTTTIPPADALASFLAQPRLEPGTAGFWRLYGASVCDIAPGDVVLDTPGADFWVCAETFTAKAAPLRFGFVDQAGARFTLGARCAVVVLRPGTCATIAGSVR